MGDSICRPSVDIRRLAGQRWARRNRRFPFGSPTRYPRARRRRGEWAQMDRRLADAILISVLRVSMLRAGRRLVGRLLADGCLDPPTPSASPARLLSQPTVLLHLAAALAVWALSLPAQHWGARGGLEVELADVCVDNREALL